MREGRILLVSTLPTEIVLFCRGMGHCVVLGCPGAPPPGPKAWWEWAAQQHTFRVILVHHGALCHFGHCPHVRYHPVDVLVRPGQNCKWGRACAPRMSAAASRHHPITKTPIPPGWQRVARLFVHVLQDDLPKDPQDEKRETIRSEPGRHCFMPSFL